MHVSCFDRLHGTCSAERGGKEDSCSEKWAHLNWRASQTWSGQKFVRVSQMKSEQLWNKFCENEAFCLFCAYPQSGFTQDASDSVMHICGAHSKMIAGVAKGKTELFYKNVDKKVG